MKRNILGVILISLFAIICQLTNYFIKINHPNLIFKNQGVVFGYFDNTLIIYGITIIGLMLLFYLIKKNQKQFLQNLLAISLTLAGVISNLIDRISSGYVIDYINTGFWPVFNIADIFITLGLFILFISLFLKS